MSLKTDSLSNPSESIATDSSGESLEAAAADHTFWDQVGIAGSLLCLVHCATTPLLVGYLSVASLSFLADEWIHKTLAVILLVIAAVAFLPGFRHHKKKSVLVVGVAGVLVLLTAGFALDHHASPPLEIGLTAFGSLLLLGAHTANWRLCARHGHEPCDDHCSH